MGQVWPFWRAQVSEEEAGGNQCAGIRVADNPGPGSQQVGTTPGSSAGSECLELWKWLWWFVADWLQAGRGPEPFPEHWKLLCVNSFKKLPMEFCVLLIKEI